MYPGFRGEVAELYRRYRRGCPEPAIDALVEAFGLTADDVVVDLGCGTGQLAVPLAARVRAVVGVDPEADVLAQARRAAAGATNLSWVIGAGTDVPALRALLGDESVGAVTIGQALHWVDRDALSRELVRLVRPGGGVAVVTNGTPLWLQDSDWSRALRGFSERWSGTRGDKTCGTDEATQRRYQGSLAAAGFAVDVDVVDYTDTLDLERIVGGVFSALPVDRLPAAGQRSEFAERVRLALEPRAPFTEHVRVTVLTGRR